MPYDSMNLTTQDRCWMTPRVSLTSLICDDGRNDGTVEELIVEVIRKASFFEWLQGFGGRCQTLMGPW